MTRGLKSGSRIVSIAIFLALETLAFTLIVKNGEIQRSALAGFTREIDGRIETGTSRMTGYFGLSDENRRLQEENLALRQLVADLSAQMGDGPVSDSLPKLSDFTYMSAGVVHNSVGSAHNSLIVNRGSKDGVTQGMGVVTSCGIVGIVDAVSENFSRVCSLLDVDMRFSAKLSKNGIFGLAGWTGGPVSRITMSEAPMHSDAARGDTVSTSGHSSIFPPDIPIGTVADASSDGVSVTMRIDLFQDFHSLSKVYIVSNRHKKELDSLKEKKEE